MVCCAIALVDEILNALLTPLHKAPAAIFFLSRSFIDPSLSASQHSTSSWPIVNPTSDETKQHDNNQHGKNRIVGSPRQSLPESLGLRKYARKHVSESKRACGLT
jgi:hypothetical protein